MQNQGKSIIWGILGILFLLGLDQGSKLWAVANLKDQSPISVISSVFELRYLENQGAAFGILQGKRIFLLAFTLIIFLILLFIYLRIPAERHYLPMKIMCVLVAAGAIGNMADRFVRGYVVDFLYFSLIDFPIFNLADCYVTISCGMVFLFVLFFYREDDFSFLWKV